MGRNMFHKLHKLFRLHLSRITTITLNTCRSTIQEMGTKFHPGENSTWRQFPAAETSRAEVANFPGSADISLPIYLQPRRAISVRYLHPFYTRFVHVPYVARAKPQTAEHFFQFYKSKTLTSVLLNLKLS
jgi:hypothetical protein